MEKHVYDPNDFIHGDTIKLTKGTKALLKEAQEVYQKNFDGKTWMGRCIFLSWYCSIADCDFCYRSVIKHKQGNPKKAKRSTGSILLEALFAKLFNWRLEFITGGLGIMPFEEIVEYIKTISEVYGEKVWVNLGDFTEQQIESLRPYVKGVCGSMETLHPQLHDKVCPSKPIQPFADMFKKLKGFKKSIAVIVGLGDKFEDIHYLLDFIKEHNLDRITIYPLKPVRGTHYTQGPTTDELLKWMATVRINFPKLQIIAGTNLRRAEESGYYMQAGANAITKFPIMKEFGKNSSKKVQQLIEAEKRTFTSNMTKKIEINWEQTINELKIKDEYKKEMIKTLPLYLEKFGKKLKVLNNCEC